MTLTAEMTAPLGNRRMFIGGEWADACDGATQDAISPRDGAVVARVPLAGREDARRALAAAAKAEEALARMSVFDRAALCQRIADAAARRQDELARALTLDQGKPYATEARWEAGAFAAFFRQAAADIVRLNGESIPSADTNKRIFTFHRPRGVYAVITPWNFPYNIPSEYISAALAAGNPVVWVPAPTVSACSTIYAECLAEADLPAGAFNLVTGPGPVAGDEIVADPRTRGVGFTGSPETGRQIAARAAGKPLLLELGGNGPVIVLDDADLGAAVEGIVFSAYFNAGQACSATERVLVSRRVLDELRDRLIVATDKVRLGDPFHSETTMGPLNNEAVAQKMDRHIADACAHGAQVVRGGQRQPEMPTGLYYQPTLLEGVTADTLVNREETFGPIIPLIGVDADDEAVAAANAVPLGLICSVYTRSLRRAFVFGHDLRSGIVNINETPNYWEAHVPYGGAAATNSGLGRLGGMNTLKEMLDVRSMIIDLGTDGGQP